MDFPSLTIPDVTGCVRRCSVPPPPDVGLECSDEEGLTAQVLLVVISR